MCVCVDMPTNENTQGERKIERERENLDVYI